MSLKKFLILPLLLSLAVFIIYSREVLNSIKILETIPVTFGLIMTLTLSVALQLAGHVVRARKAQYLFNPIKPNTTRFQFRALSIGYLFNSLLPLRLGELIRARILAGGMDLSFSFTLSLIVVERAFDAAILAVTGLIFLLMLSVTETELFIYTVTLLALALVVALAVLAVLRQDRRFIRWLYRLSGIFKPTIQNSFRFKAWSVIYGLQTTLRPARLVRYVGLSLTSWFFYGCSTFILARYFLTNVKAGQELLAAAAPYFGVAVPSGPANLGSFSKITDVFTQSLLLNPNEALIFDLVAWSVLIIPISLIGMALLFTKTREPLWRKAPQGSSVGALENKLYRSEDISQEMSRFLENYFSGNTLSHIVHRLELKNNFRLLKYFKGGSDAITILARQDSQEVVKKIIPPEFEDRLKAQYNWLKERGGKKGIVQVLKEEKTPHYYAIDLEYRPEDVMLFDFMHQNPIARSQKILDEVWGYLYKNVYGKPAKLRVLADKRDAYIDKHIFGCLEKAALVDAELLNAAKPKKLIINGRKYDNLYQIMDKIKKHPQAWHDLASYQEASAVHGDVAVDNILVSKKDGHALLIDPAPDGNIINGPVFDFGKNMQSLYCGYEFLLRDEDPVYLIDNTIDYREHSSAQYTQLCDYVRNSLAPKYLSEAELKAITFHAAALHIRRLKHQVYYNPANTLKFYAVGVKTLNDFLAQYD